MNFLNNATSTWSNIPNLKLTYNDEGGHFTNFQVTGKARLPYLSEVDDYDGTNGYLYDHLDVDCYDDDWNIDNISCDLSNHIDGVYEEGIENIQGILGYWTFSSHDESSDFAFIVEFGGSVYEGSIIDASLAGGLGVRPVINVKL